VTDAVVAACEGSGLVFTPHGEVALKGLGAPIGLSEARLPD
jgi:hypothetical protein